MTTLQPASISRQVLIAAALFMAVWATQIRYPPLSYPYIGQLLVVILSGLLILLQIWSKTSRPIATLSHPALLPGFLFVIWVLVRWAFTGFTALGGEEVGTILWLAVYTVGAYWLANMHTPTSTSLNPLFRGVVTLISGAGLICGIHALWQYHVSYEQSYQQLLASIGPRDPDMTELGLLHHLKLRRVASVFGDPNNLATFSALALCASIELLTFTRMWQKSIGVIAILPILAAIFYSGSRGGLLDILGIILLYAILFVRNMTVTRGAKAAAALILLATFLSGTRSTDAEAVAPDVPVSSDNSSAWAWRSSTIQERIYYLDVGWKMVRLAPLTGLGPGGVDTFFGRLKAPEARETKYLHNWIIQIAAEYGLIGVTLAVWFLAGTLAAAWRRGLLFQQGTRAFGIMILMIIGDALIQVTWNQRELVSTFGAICGFTMAASSTSAPVAQLSKMKTVSALLLVASFLVIETLNMGNAAAKQTASDFGYAGDLRSADRFWRRASGWLANDSEPFAARASIALQEGRLMQSKNLIDQALHLSPQSASLHVQAADIYHNLGKAKESDKHLTKALEIYPTQPDYNYRMAKSLADRGQTTQALSFALRAGKYNYLVEKAPVYKKLISELETIDK